MPDLETRWEGGPKRWGTEVLRGGERVNIDYRCGNGRDGSEVK